MSAALQLNVCRRRHKSPPFDPYISCILLQQKTGGQAPTKCV